MRIIRFEALSAVLVAGLLGVSAGVAAAQLSAAPATPGKFAFIRGQDILAQTPGRAELEAQFNKEVDSARAVEKVWGDSMNAMVGDYARVEATLTQDQKTARQASLRQQQAAFQQRQQQLEQQVQADNQRLVAPILQRVNVIIDQVRQDGHYAMIFDVQANGGGVVAADKTLDITDQVVAKLKAAGPMTAAPAAPSTTTPARPTAGPTSAPSGVSRPKP
jgi:outer membrane protein